MLVRIRWFLLGVLTAFGAGAYVLNQVRQMREKLAPRSVARAGANGVADLIDATARRIRPDAQ